MEMPDKSRIVLPGRGDRMVLAEGGERLVPPDDWVLLPPGDAALTRRVKQAGPCWQVQVKRGRRVFSGGVWAPGNIVDEARKMLEEKRATPQYKKKRVADLARRELKQENYCREFHANVLQFLDFAPCYAELAEKMATAVTDHAVPVGSGTVARTERIPVEERAAAAVIAWMRHQVTGYDTMYIPRIKGKRREVRRQLAQASKKMLDRYRAGTPVDPVSCPLTCALK